METLHQLFGDLNIATTILLLILFLGAWVLWKVQSDKNNHFNFEEMLRDDNGKPSAFRLAIFVCLAVSTWVIMYIVLNTNTIDTWMFVTYVGIWSGAKIAETALNAYSNGTSGRKLSHRHTSIDTSEEIEQEPDSGTEEPRYKPPRR